MPEHSRIKPYFDIYLRYRDSSEELSPHYHYNHQIIFITEGSAQFDIGRKSYKAGPGSMILISNFESHGMKVLKRPYKRYVLAMNSEFSAAYLRHPIFLSIFLRRPDNFSNLLELDSKTVYTVTELCKKMTDELEPRQVLWEENVAAMVMQMLIAVYRYSSEPFWPSSASAASNLIFKVQRYISLNYQNRLTLEKLSKEFFVSTYYLSHAFKSVTGFNYKDYLIRYRLSIAKDLLANSSMPVTEICTACGYNNINHFNRIFKLYEGMSPSQCRKNAVSFREE